MSRLTRTGFFGKVLKAEGYRFRKAKVRFGVIASDRKFESRKIRSALIAQLFVAGDTVFFYDECTFSMNDFKGKRWSHSSNQQPLHLRFPGLRIKLNILIAQKKLLAFQLSLDHHTSENVFNFITVSMAMSA